MLYYSQAYLTGVNVQVNLSGTLCITSFREAQNCVNTTNQQHSTARLRHLLRKVVIAFTLVRQIDIQFGYFFVPFAIRHILHGLTS